METNTKQKPENLIYKVGAVIIKDRKVLVCRNIGKEIFISPGGRIEEGEEDIECLERELREELGVRVSRWDYLGDVEEEAILDPGKEVKIYFYRAEIAGEPKASSEIGEIRYINSQYGEIKLGSGIEKFVVPKLVEMGLID
jgi:8-oxo-dGTP pyrophosphatase MutT (NUDIX family)